jgi:hypothetical protein
VCMFTLTYLLCLHKREETAQTLSDTTANTKRLKLHLLSLGRESLVLLQLLDSVVVST